MNTERKKIYDQTYLHTVTSDAEGIFKVCFGENNNLNVIRPNGTEIEFDNELAQMMDPEYRADLKKATEDYRAGIISLDEFLISYLEAFAKHLHMKVFMRCHAPIQAGGNNGR